MTKLFVIAGHGAGDPGACGNSYTEAELVRALARKIKDFGGDNVLLGDLSRNYYRDNGISSLTISKEYKILELHMDSAGPGARGGHVIIKAGFKADAFDNALAQLMKDMLPGRSALIVGRKDLANPNRAARKGYNYRLLECGFISNAGDVSIFNNRMNDLAKGILAAFKIPIVTTSNKPSSTSYYPAFHATSIVDGLKSIKVDSSFTNRKKIAAANGIQDYTGTANQNGKLLSLAKQGKLKKA